MSIDHKLTNGQNLTVLTSHDVSEILNSKVQSNNGSVFKAAVTQGAWKTLWIEYHLHSSWRHQYSEKTEKANNIIKRHLCKQTQETQDSWFKFLPVALMRAGTAPKKEGLSPFECIYGRPFLHTDIVIDSEALKLTMWLSFQLFNLLINWRLPMVGFSTSRKGLSSPLHHNNRMWRLFGIWWPLTILRWIDVTMDIMYF